jgi:hypothetical protein
VLPLKTVLVESHTGPAPFGGKSIAENPNSPTAAAIANAIADACGVRLFDLPLMRKRFIALQSRGGALRPLDALDRTDNVEEARSFQGERALHGSWKLRRALDPVGLDSVRSGKRAQVRKWEIGADDPAAPVPDLVALHVPVGAISDHDDGDGKVPRGGSGHLLGF